VTYPRFSLATQRLALPLVGVALTATLVWAGPPGNDLAAHVFQRDLFIDHGFALWNNFWYAGRYSFVTYSLVYYPVAALVGIRVLAAASVAVAVYFFAVVVEEEWGSHARWPNRAFAVVWPLSALSGAFPFLLGAALALGALRALQVRRLRVFAVLALLTLGASPLAFLLLAVILGGIAASRRSSRGVVPALVVVTGAAIEVVLRRLFPDHGRYPFSPEELLGACTFCMIGLALTWRVQAARLLRLFFGAYLAACLLAYAVPSALGENVLRLRFMAVPLAALALSLRHWRPLPVSVIAFLLACSWNLTPLGFSLVRSARDPSAARAYWSPAIDFLRTQSSPSYRTEVVDTAGHWGASYLAEASIPLARGWFRQDDFPQNKLLYGRLAPRAYVAWLRRLGVRYVVLTDAPQDYSSRQEAALVQSGRSGLRPVLKTVHVTVCALPRPTPILTGPGRPRVLEVTPSGVRLSLDRPGAYRLAVRYSPYWRARSICVAETSDGMTRILAGKPGPVDLDLQFTASSAVRAFAGAEATCAKPVAARGRSRAA
jgi:hypothetical protein